MSRPTAFEFPCSFPLKVIGKDETGFLEIVSTIVQKHVGELRESAFSLRSSEQGKYLSVTVTFTATSQDQLDTLYRELTSHERIVMVL